MRCKQTCLFLTLVFCLAGVVHAQQWSGILDPSRAIDWSSAGVKGGIPNPTNICVTRSAGTSAATINSDITNCSNAGGGVVYLNAGTYSMTTGISLKSNVTLRGGGANATILNFSGTGSYYWGGYYVGFQGYWTNTAAEGPPGPATGADPAKTRNWTGTAEGGAGVYPKGATHLILNSAPTGLLVGDMLELTQNDDAGVANGVLVCSAGACSREGSGYTYGTAQRQNVRVEAINGNTVTIYPGIYAGNWRTSQSPKANWWGGDIRMAGLEDLRVNGSVQTWAAILFWHAADCWMSGVAVAPYVGSSWSSTRHGILLHITRNITIQNSWLDRMAGGGNGSTTSYGIAPFGSTASLILNNIVRDVESPMLSNTDPVGDVFAYNYVPNVCTAPSGCSGLYTGHEVGSQYLLLEGNIGTLIRGDTYHGTHNLWTIFRNYLSSSAEASLDLQSHVRYVNVVGNILGSASPASYECENSTSGTCGRYAANIYRLGYPGGDAVSSQAGVSYDSQVKTTLLRWGNYDTKNAATRWLCTEVPTGIAGYGNACPGPDGKASVLPPSFYLVSRPGWWPAGKPWPPIGPDVSGGNIPGVGGHAYTIPAQDCYTGISGNIQSFNAATCYGQTRGSVPVPPAGAPSLVVR